MAESIHPEESIPWRNQFLQRYQCLLELIYFLKQNRIEQNRIVYLSSSHYDNYVPYVPPQDGSTRRRPSSTRQRLCVLWTTCTPSQAGCLPPLKSAHKSKDKFFLLQCSGSGAGSGSVGSVSFWASRIQSRMSTPVKSAQKSRTIFLISCSALDFGSGESVSFWASRIQSRIRYSEVRIRIRILPSSSKTSKENFYFCWLVTFF